MGGRREWWVESYSRLCAVQTHAAYHIQTCMETLFAGPHSFEWLVGVMRCNSFLRCSSYIWWKMLQLWASFWASLPEQMHTFVKGNSPSPVERFYLKTKQTALICVLESGHAHVKYKHMLPTASDIWIYRSDWGWKCGILEWWALSQFKLSLSWICFIMDYLSWGCGSTF